MSEEKTVNIYNWSRVSMEVNVEPWAHTYVLQPEESIAVSCTVHEDMSLEAYIFQKEGYLEVFAPGNEVVITTKSGTDRFTYDGSIRWMLEGPGERRADS